MAVAIKAKARDIPQRPRPRADADALERGDGGVGADLVLLELPVGKAALKLAGEVPHELQDDDAVTDDQAVEVAAVPPLGDAAGEAEQEVARPSCAFRQIGRVTGTSFSSPTQRQHC